MTTHVKDWWTAVVIHLEGGVALGAVCEAVKQLKNVPDEN